MIICTKKHYFFTLAFMATNSILGMYNGNCHVQDFTKKPPYWQTACKFAPQHTEFINKFIMNIPPTQRNEILEHLEELSTNTRNRTKKKSQEFNTRPNSSNRLMNFYNKKIMNLYNKKMKRGALFLAAAACSTAVAYVTIRKGYSLSLNEFSFTNLTKGILCLSAGTFSSISGLFCFAKSISPLFDGFLYQRYLDIKIDKATTVNNSCNEARLRIQKLHE